jgi:hypothetical protein
MRLRNIHLEFLIKQSDERLLHRQDRTARDFICVKDSDQPLKLVQNGLLEFSPSMHQSPNPVNAMFDVDV